MAQLGSAEAPDSYLRVDEYQDSLRAKEEAKQKYIEENEKRRVAREDKKSDREEETAKKNVMLLPINETYGMTYKDSERVSRTMKYNINNTLLNMASFHNYPKFNEDGTLRCWENCALRKSSSWNNLLSPNYHIE